MSDQPDKPPDLKKPNDNTEYGVSYVVMEAIHDHSNKLDKLDDRLDRKLDALSDKIDRKFDKVIEDLANLRERATKIETKVDGLPSTIETKIQDLPDIKKRLQRVEWVVWAIVGAIILSGWLGNFLVKLFK